jgi:hypothetical protein
MDFIPSCNFNVLHLVLPDGIAQCGGYGLLSWIAKCVILMNESRVDVERGICHSVSIELVIDSDGMPLSNNCILVQIVE